MIHLEPSRELNLIIGKNGSGKTALLESIYLMGRGRSFRTRRLSRLIALNCDSFRIKGRFEDSVGFNVDITGQSSLMDVVLEGRKILNRGELIRSIPISLLSDATGTLVDCTPEIRRRFMDWIMFHVEPGVAQQMAMQGRIREALSRLLKSGSLGERKAWYRQFHDVSELVVREIQPFVERLQAELLRLSEQFLFLHGIELNYRRGWEEGKDLISVLLEQDNQAVRRGYVLSGPQRGDLLITKGSKSIADYFSKGEKRILSILLVLSAVLLISKFTGAKFILLLDDIEAEIDFEHQLRLLDILSKIGAQTFITCTKGQDLAAALPSFSNGEPGIIASFRILSPFDELRFQEHQGA
jgi:DNA replication and repair protein RecF